MLYHLLFPLAGKFEPFNLFRYQTFRSGGAVVTALVICFIAGPRVISWLKSKQAEGQPIRVDGPEGHLLRKKGTPTMGGFLILLAVTTSTLLWADLTNAYVWVTLLVTVGFGAIGFFDDYKKLTRRSSRGLSSKAKFLAQVALSAAATLAVIYITREPLGTSLAVPFFKSILPDLGWLFLPLGVFVITGASNAVNLTDGLDGLAIVPAMIAASCLSLIAYLVGNVTFANYLAIIGGLFVLETVSVIMQVASYKLTGKRVFRMAPLHHHFEKKGWQEPTIVIRFWIIASILAIAGLATLKLR